MGDSVDINEAAQVFASQMENNSELSADFQSVGNSEHVGQRM